MNADRTFNGDFRVSGGPGAVLFIPAGVDIYVAGDMGDPGNNGIIYNVNGTLHVEGTLYGKNTNSFIGSGTITGGTLDIKNGGTCGTPCPVTGGFDECHSDNSNNFCEAVLPVKLLYFLADPTEKTVRLAWATSVEENFSQFIVQRSVDGLTFQDIGEVEGRGFNIYGIETEYTFVDVNPLLGRNYYRLKAIDVDETFEYFGVKAVNMKGGKTLTVFPNPVSGRVISFTTNFSPQESDRVILMDQLGGEIFNDLASHLDNNLVLPDELKPGVYVIRYVSPEFEKTARVVVNN